MTYSLPIARGLRTRIRARLANEIAQFENDADSTFAIDPCAAAQRLSLIKTLLESVEAYNAHILQHPELKPGEHVGEIDAIDEINQKSYSAMAKLRAIIDPSLQIIESTPVLMRSKLFAVPGASSTPIAPTLPAAATSAPPELATSSAACHSSCRKLDLSPEPFDGTRSRFRQFLTQFKRWVEGRHESTPCERLMVLRKYLTGEPKTLIDSLELTDANYAVALELLETNYDRVDNERQRLVAACRNLPRVPKAQDLSSLRRLVTTVQAHTKALEALGVPLSAIAVSLESALDEALPTQLRNEFRESLRLEKRLNALSLTRDTSEDGSSSSVCEDIVDRVGKYLQFLRQYLIDRENLSFAETAAPEAKVPKNSQSKPDRGSRPKTATVAGVSGGQTRVERKARPCLFCKTSEHNTSRCPATLTYEQRCEVLDQLARCRKCFRPRHGAPSECKGPRAPCQVCRKADHYSSMHRESVTPPAVVAAATDSATLVLTASAYLLSGTQKIPIQVFVDPGSTLTFISPSARAALRDAKPVDHSTFEIQTFITKHELNVPSYVVQIGSTRNSSTVELTTHEYDFAVAPPSQSIQGAMTAMKLFDRGHPLADRSLLDGWQPQRPSILIGIDQLYKIWTSSVVKPIAEGLLAFETLLGWMLGGPILSSTHSKRKALCCHVSMSQPAQELETLWSLEAIGIKDQETPSKYSADEEEAVKQFNATVAYENNRYTVCMPKKRSIDSLANNRQNAEDRLRRKLRQLERDPSQYQRYHEEITKFFADGHSIEVPASISGGAFDGTYYMPHHAVITQNGDKEKCRIVFDCSAKAKDSASSLNENLLAGPSINGDLVALLLNFRLRRVVLSADVSKAYMRISVHPEDQKYFRYLWKGPADEFVKCYQMTKVTWGATPSGFLLAAVLREHFKKADPTTAAALDRSFYADDFVRSFPSDEAAIEFANRLRSIMSSAGMELAKWKSNSRTVLEHLASVGVPPQAFETQTSSLFKVLGIAWDPESDVLLFCQPPVDDLQNEPRRTTKRSIVSRIASIYDPLGMLAPFTLRGKRIIKSLWTHGLDWNDEVPSDVAASFRQWIAELGVLRNHTIPRCYSTRKEVPTASRLHIFGDASQVAYACAAFVEHRYSDGSSAVALVMSKSRVAPRDAPTLPRLELLAALLATRLKDFLIERMEMTFERTSFYTDSMITYHWATSTSPGDWKTFVSNRVQEIQRRSRKEDWYFVPGVSNIADIATRGVSAQELRDHGEWWTGPSWLQLPLPDQPVSQPKGSTGSLEPVQQEARHTVTAVTTTDPPPAIIDLGRFSSAHRAARSLAVALRFRHIAGKLPDEPEFTVFVKRAQLLIIKMVQQHHFAEELQCAKAGERVRSTSKLAAFNIFVDDSGLLRAKTRLEKNPCLTYDEKNPVIIPGESRFATLLILDVHHANAHFGVPTVLASVRRQFWITRARQIAKAIIRRCVICRKRQGAHASEVEAPLPVFRATFLFPFQTSGLDFCGPFYTRSREGTYKTYIAVFVCASVRAVHLEAVPSMTAPQTLLAIRRFLSTYPACRRFVSDNARSFTKAATEIKRIFNSLKDPETRRLLEEKTIEWEFLCPRAPWFAGSHERFVGTVKRALSKTLGKSLVHFEEFRTVLSEISTIINSRPITHVSTEIDAPTPLTPGCFLRGGPAVSPIQTLLPLDQLGPPLGDELREAHKKRTTFLKNLSVRWYREYLLMLRSANLTQMRPTRGIAVGDVCVLKEDNAPRVHWPLVKIEKAHPGRDGKIRVYEIRLSNGKTTRRAAQLLYPLEVVEPVTPRAPAEETSQVVSVASVK